MTLRLDGYVRVSRIGGREGEGYISPAVQREAIEGYARELGGEIVHWQDDQDHTGGNVERPGFQAILKRLGDRETDGIVVMKVDRFARSAADGTTIIRDIDERGQVFASCAERMDTKTPEGKFMVTNFLASAELFLDQIKAGWNTTKAQAVARGVHIGPTPLGYQREKSKPLLVDPHYGPAITELFERAAAGNEGDSALAHWMTRRAPRKSGQPWQGSEIRRWFTTRTYLGEVNYGPLSNTEAHPPLTDPDTFAAVQREPGVQRRNSSSPFLLSGLVRCACCRYSMSGSNTGGADRGTPIYRCPRSSKGCDAAPVITAKRIEDHVLDAVRDQLRGLELEAADAGADLPTLEREASEAVSELEAFAADLGARRALGEQGWQTALTARVEDRDRKIAARDQAFHSSRLLTVAGGLDDLDHDGLRDLLTGMIRVVFVRRAGRGASADERALIVWSDDPRVIDVPGPHRSGPYEPIRW